MRTKTFSFLVAGCLWWLGVNATAEEFRTDINPALLSWQAFAVMPDLTPDEQKHLFDTEWRSRPMDDKAGQLAQRFDSTFRLLRQAAASKVPCDWGIDLSLGPQALLPHLAKAKRCAQAATLRARWCVQQGNQESARDDLGAAFVLARNLSRDGVLISALVQYAMESIVSGYVVQQWPQLSTETIGAVLSGFDNAPPRGTIAACMRTEKIAFYGWILRKVDAIRATYPNQEAAAVKAAAQLLTEIASEEGQPRTGFGDEVIRAAGNSIAGLVNYIRELEPFYDDLERIMNLPYPEFQPALDEFQSKFAANPNLLLHELFPAMFKVRLKEFRIAARLAMVHAAYQIRLDPANGLGRVQDPFGTGPFQYTRFVLDGVDRGFKLESELRSPDFNEVLIFAEKGGPAFSVDGPPAGQKVP